MAEKIEDDTFHCPYCGVLLTVPDCPEGMKQCLNTGRSFRYKVFDYGPTLKTIRLTDTQGNPIKTMGDPD